MALECSTAGRAPAECLGPHRTPSLQQPEELNNFDRFRLAMSQVVGRRVTYKELSGKTFNSADATNLRRSPRWTAWPHHQVPEMRKRRSQNHAHEQVQGLPYMQTEGEKVRWHFPEVPHVGFVDHVVRGRVELDRKGVRTKQLVLDGLQDVPADAFASVAAIDLQVSNPADRRFRFRYLRVEFAAPIGFRMTTLFKSVGDSTFARGHVQIR
jgi:hypothetical protein